jgi:hypothetical protein
VIDYILSNPVEIFDLALALIGFLLLGIEVWKARTAAEAAKQASDLAFERISSRTTLADIYGITGILREIRDALRNGNYHPALFRCEHVRPQLHKLRMREDFSSDEKKQEIQEMIIGIRKLQDSLERIIVDDTEQIDSPKVNLGLADYSSRLYEMAEELKYIKRESEK